ncbi:MAG: glycosyltransferase [Planctomycetota bacterium]
MSNDALKVGYFVAGISSQASGLATAIQGWSDAVSKFTPAQIRLYTVQCQQKGFTDFELEPPAQLIREPGSWSFRLNRSTALKQRIMHDSVELDLYHNHCIWTMPSYYAHLASQSQRRPLMITPHGAMNDVALKRSSFKKSIIRWIFQSKVIEKASCFHAFTQNEAESIRKSGVTQPIAIIPNGIALPDVEDSGDSTTLGEGAALLEQFPELKNKKIVLFLARLHPIKGIDYLIPAWAELAKRNPDWQLVLAGPDGGHLSWIESEIASKNLNDHVTLTGPLYGSMKQSAFEAAELFLLPSYSEGFSMTVLEALAHRVPVLISDQCNFPEVASENAGLICKTETTDLMKVLQQMISMSENDRMTMGNRGRQMVESNYTWETVAQKMHRVYQWQVDGQRPDDVEIV